MKSKFSDGKFFEVVNKPWFGPKKRAKEHLQKRVSLATPAEAYEILVKLLPQGQNYIQEIRFYDYVDTKDNFHYTIAIIWTESNSKFRDAIYGLAEKWVESSGWYALPQGERIGSRNTMHSFFNDRKWNAKLPVFNGHIDSVSSIVEPQGGCSIGVKIGTDYLILDTGLEGSLSPQKLDRLCFVSHTHGDHTGNIRAINKAKIPVIMSEATSYLLSKFKVISERDLSENTIAMAPGNVIELGPGLEFKMIPVPHMPGSVGGIIRDENKALVFSGDICFRTARHDYIDEFVSIVKDIPSKEKFVMIDATMALRPLGASSTDTAKLICEDLSLKDVVFSAPSADHLLYAYLDIFHYIKDSEHRNTVLFGLGSRLRAMFECVHESFITRKHQELDPFLLAQYQQTMSSWAESRWLIWMPSTLPSKTEYRRFWFISDAETKSAQIPQSAVHVRIGRDGGYEDRKNLKVDTKAWSLHSDEESLVEVTKKLEGIAKVIFFHSSEEKLKRFIKDNKLNAVALTQRELKLT